MLVLKLTGTVSLLLLLVCGGLALVSYHAASRILQNSIEETLVSLSDKSGRYIGSVIQSYRNHVEMAADRYVIRGMNWELQQGALLEKMERSEFIDMGIISGSEGVFLVRNQYWLPVEQSIVKEAFEGFTVNSDVIIPVAQKRPVIQFAAPVRDEKDSVIAVLVGWIDGLTLSKIASGIGFGVDGYSYIINSKGHLIAHGTELDLVMDKRNFIEEAKVDPEFHNLAVMMQRMVKGEAGFSEYWFRGSDRYFGYAPIPGTDWSIAVGSIKEYVFAGIYAMRWTFASLSFGFIALGVVITILFSRTVTDRRRAEEALRESEIARQKQELIAKAAEEKEKMQQQFMQVQKMESVGRLAGGIAHDFNNMLGAIIGYSEIGLGQVGPGSEIESSLNQILKAAERSANLTRQLLGFARKQTIAPKVVKLNEIVEGMLDMLRRLIGENIFLGWYPHEGIGDVVMDTSQLDQILINLCLNARDAIDDTGKITIETQSAYFDENYCKQHAEFVPGNYVMLAVSDDGCGIDSESMPQLFEPFFTTKPVGEGTGLGLATVYGIVRQNNGFVNVYSELNQGTTFKVYFPGYDGAAVAGSGESKFAGTCRGTETILLVEDESILLDMTKTILQLKGYNVRGFTTPGEALQWAQDYKDAIHLLITDVVMPQMNGVDLSLKIVSVHPETRCLYMSGYTGNVIVHHGVVDEGVHFIQKPFTQKDLATKVRGVLNDGDYGN